MSAAAARFKLDDELALGGKTMRVTGMVQYEAPQAKTRTRYFLSASSPGAAQILEEADGQLTLLRAFPPASMPQAAGDTVSVMGAKYKLATVDKLKVLKQAGQAPGGAAGAMLLSGLFKGEAGSLLREMTPGQPAQSYYALKPLPADAVMDAAQVAAAAEAAKAAAQQRAAAAAEDSDGEEEAGGSMLGKIAGWVVPVLVVIGLAWACTDESSEESSGSARSSVRISSGGK